MSTKVVVQVSVSAGVTVRWRIHQTPPSRRYRRYLRYRHYCLTEDGRVSEEGALWVGVAGVAGVGGSLNPGVGRGGDGGPHVAEPGRGGGGGGHESHSGWSA